MDAKLCGTPITGEHLAKYFAEKFGSHAILRQIEAEKIAAGQGFMSHILRAKLTWETEDSLPKTIIVKVSSSETMTTAFEEMTPTEEERVQNKKAMDVGIKLFHKAECEVYKMLDHDSPIPVPRYYASSLGYDRGGDAPAFIALEDLSETSSIIPCLVAGLSLGQVLEAVGAVAKLHGWSLVTTVEWRHRVGTIEERMELFKQFAEKTGDALQMVKDKYPADFAHMDVEFATKHAADIDYLDRSSRKHQTFMEDVLTHGDYWANNILYEKRPDGSVGDRLVAMIDFQLAIKGGPMPDLARLLTWSVSEKIRREHIDEILRHYYDTFKSIAGDKLTATYEQLEESYHESFAISALHCVSGLPMMIKFMVTSEKEKREQDERVFVDRMVAAFDDAMKTLKK